MKLPDGREIFGPFARAIAYAEAGLSGSTLVRYVLYKAQKTLLSGLGSQASAYGTSNAIRDLCLESLLPD